MAIDNHWYDAVGDGWWDASGPLCVLHEMNPVRSAYFRSAIRQGLGDLRGVRVLDVGCGGGLISEQLAKGGALVSGLDLSANSIAVAQRHAAAGGLAIDYQVGSVFDLPYADGEFDAVISSDFLEHVSNHLEDAVSEMCRVLRPGGVFAFDTINRTARSYLIAIVALQRLLGAVPANTHEWGMFLKPDEVIMCLNRAGVQTLAVRGLQPKLTPPAAALRLLRERKLGGFKLGHNLNLSYIGWGTKRG